MINKHLQKSSLTWETAELTALDRQQWHRSVTKCIRLHSDWVKVKDKVKMCVRVRHQIGRSQAAEFIRKSLSVRQAGRPTDHHVLGELS